MFLVSKVVQNTYVCSYVCISKGPLYRENVGAEMEGLEVHMYIRTYVHLIIGNHTYVRIYTHVLRDWESEARLL